MRSASETWWPSFARCRAGGWAYHHDGDFCDTGSGRGIYDKDQHALETSEDLRDVMLVEHALPIFLL